jgi:SAM-dependent methyltransferase
VTWSERTSCSLCRSEQLVPCLKMPNTPLANEFMTKPGPQEEFPLYLLTCLACGHLQSGVVVPPSRLFRDYVYESSTSAITVAHLRDEARTIDAVLGLRRKEKSFIVELGSNDGSMLNQFFELGIPKAHLLGIDPAEKMAKIASEKGLRTLVDFFSRAYAEEFKTTYVEPDVVVANNILAHVPDVLDVLEGIKLVVGDAGVLVMEVAHAGDLLRGAWDTIYHEHLSHHAFGPLASALELVGLPVFDVDIVDGQVGRGSLRVWAGKSRARTNEQEKKIKFLLEMEETEQLTAPETWRHLEARIRAEGFRVRRELQDWQGKEIWGYGAPAKMTTLSYAYRLKGIPLRGVADDSLWKQGLLTPGTQIEVTSINSLVEAKPDLVIIFAWNFADDIRRKLRESGYDGPAVTPQELAR